MSSNENFGGALKNKSFKLCMENKINCAYFKTEAHRLDLPRINKFNA
jgi:hypothetical protein